MLSLDKVFDAQTVLKSIIRETNVVKTYGIAPDCDLYLKPENLQITGSFKVRGSAYKISQLSAEEKAKGVIACSAGNHAQGVALAATKNGIKSLICLPDSAPISKVEATKGYGAEVCLVEGVYDDAYNKAIADVIAPPDPFQRVTCLEFFVQVFFGQFLHKRIKHRLCPRLHLSKIIVQHPGGQQIVISHPVVLL